MIDYDSISVPDLALHPGNLLKEELDERGITQKELADRMGRPAQVINQIVQEKKSVTPQTALELERVLGVNARLWLNLQQNHDLVRERQREVGELERSSSDWLRRFPYQEMSRLRWVEEEERSGHRLRNLLSFFAVASFDTLESAVNDARFRATEKAKVDKWALTAWLQRGKQIAESRETRPFDLDRFRTAVDEIRTLTETDRFFPQMVQLCAQAGVALVAVPHLPKTGANGAARWLDPNKAMIQLNLRYSWADIFWFTFFHEASHILERDTKRVFVDLKGAPTRDAAEAAADTFSADMLIPRREWAAYVDRGKFTASAVQSFATQIQCRPGIIVGRLQHEKLIPQNRHNGLREQLEFAADSA